jgi:hypothetical protein
LKKLFKYWRQDILHQSKTKGSNFKQFNVRINSKISLATYQGKKIKRIWKSTMQEFDEKLNAFKE